MSDPRQDPAFFHRRIRHISDEDLFAALDGIASYEQWGAHWTRARDRVRFLDADELLVDRVAAVASHAPRRAQILATAEQIFAGRINGWGDLTIDHGPAIDFNADYGESGQYGFHYWLWARPLIQAHLLTGEERYLDHFERLFHQWYEQRDLVHGRIAKLDVIWYELGLGLRNRVFLEFYALIDNPAPLLHERMLKTLLGAARWLFEEQKLGNRLGNWQIMGSTGLAQIGLLIPEFRESREWAQLAVERLLWHLARDFYPDGCHWERVPSSYMLTAYRDPRNLAVLAGSSSRQLLEPLERTLDWYLYCLPPSGQIPAMNDGSRIPFPKALWRDGMALFARRDLLHPLADPQAIEPEHRSCHFPASGFTAFRSDWSRDARFMLINHGPKGGGHTHDDALSVELHAFGRALAIDAGIGPSYDDPLQHTWYTRPRAHNMLTIDGAALDRAAAAGTDVIFRQSDEIESFSGTHRGYEKSSGLLHRRHVLFVRGEYFLIVDDIIGDPSAAQTCTFHLHTPQPLTASPARLYTDNLLILPAGEHTSALAKGIACVRGIPGHSTAYAQIDWLQLTFPAARKRLAVLLYPYQGAAPAINLTADNDDFTITLPDRTDVLALPSDQ